MDSEFREIEGGETERWRGGVMGSYLHLGRLIQDLDHETEG